MCGMARSYIRLHGIALTEDCDRYAPLCMSLYRSQYKRIRVADDFCLYLYDLDTLLLCIEEDLVAMQIYATAR